MDIRTHAALLLLWPVMLSFPAFPQTITSGEITGTVRDSSGAVVVAASVRLKNSDTGDTTEAPSSGSGVYRFTFVKPGSYEISAAAAGLQSDAGTFLATLASARFFRR